MAKEKLSDLERKGCGKKVYHREKSNSLCREVSCEKSRLYPLPFAFSLRAFLRLWVYRLQSELI